MAKNSAYHREPLTGIKSIRAVLQGLPLDLQRTILADGVRAGARPLVRHAKRNAPTRTGALRASIDSDVRKPKRGTFVYAIVGPVRGYFRAGKRLKRGESARGADAPANYAHLVEFGHVKASGGFIRKRKGVSTGKVVGFVAPRPFMLPALFASAADTGEQLADGLRRGIEKARAKLVNSGKAAA